MLRLLTLAVASAVLGAALTGPASAQTVLVRVVHDGTSEPVFGAIAHLLDDAGTVLRSALTDEQGRALFPAMPAARYRARAEMIGMATIESDPFDVEGGAPAIRELRLVPRPVSLATLDVSAGRRECTPRPAEEGRVLASVWDEARKALTAAALTEAQNLYRYETATFQRDELEDGVMDRGETRQQGFRRMPFETLSPEDLADAGFVRLVGTDLVYYAPDANVLLSNEFTASHCFRLVEDPSSAGVVGIGFEPLERRRGVVDIEGTLWLDRETAELRWLDYAYANLDLPVRAEAGGQVTFQRMPSGRWIVPDWWIEMPILGGRVLGDGSRRAELRGTRRSGGRVLEVLEGGGRALEGFSPGAGLRGGIEGVVVDSAALPVAGARIGVVGGNQEAFADTQGAFSLLGLSGGSYEVRYVDPRWDDYGLVPPTVARRVIPGEVSYLALYMPTLSELLREACRGQAAGGGASLAGRVEDAQGAPLDGAVVRATWAAPRPGGAAADGAGGMAIRRRIEAATNADGTYLMCDLPRGRAVELSTIVGDVEAPAEPITIGAEEAGAIRELTRDDVRP
jgi:hypothetical protein